MKMKTGVSEEEEEEEEQAQCLKSDRSMRQPLNFHINSPEFDVWSQRTESLASCDFPPGFSEEPQSSCTKPRTNDLYFHGENEWCDAEEEQRGPQTSSPTQKDELEQKVLDEHKISVRRRCEHVMDETGSRTLLSRIYTELHITEGQSEETEFLRLDGDQRFSLDLGSDVKSLPPPRARPQRQRAAGVDADAAEESKLSTGDSVQPNRWLTNAIFTKQKTLLFILTLS